MDTETGIKDGDKNKRPCYMWVLLLLFICAVGGIIAAIFVIDKIKKDETEDVYNGGVGGGSNTQLNLQPTNYTVLILGAGVSGLKAAQVLIEAGANVQILEGSNRIGGRIKSATIAGVNVEEGATWIYGASNENPMYRLAEKVNLTTTLLNYESYVFLNQTGYDVTEEADELYEKWEEVFEKVEELSERKRKNNEKDISMRKALLMNGWSSDTPLERTLEYNEVDYEYGWEPDVLSTKYSTSADEAFGDDEYYITDQRGYSYAIHTMADEFLKQNDSRLHLNTVVTEVEHSASGVKVSTSGGEVYEADFAVMTFSIGVLQHDVVKFTPEMPQWKREAIFKYDFVYYAHVNLKFDTTFWQDVEWIMHASNRRNYFPVFSSFDKHLTEGQLKDFGPTNILMAGLAGEEAYRVTSLPDEEIKQELMAVLRGIYGNGIPEPTHVLANRWAHNPLFYGSFTARPIGFDASLMSDLKAPLGRLYFAGEAYMDELNGYAHGAYLSAQRETKNILDCMRTNCTRSQS